MPGGFFVAVLFPAASAGVGLAAVQDEGMPAAERPIQFLIQSLRAQPLLIVLRPAEPLAASPQLERLQALGLRHIEIAWQPGGGWAEQMAALVRRFPALELGAASVCEVRGVEEAAAAGCRVHVLIPDDVPKDQLGRLYDASWVFLQSLEQVRMEGEGLSTVG